MIEQGTYNDSIWPFRNIARKLLNPLPNLSLLKIEEYRLGPEVAPLVDFSPFAGLTAPSERMPVEPPGDSVRTRPATERRLHGDDPIRSESDRRKSASSTPRAVTAPAEPSGDRPYPVISIRNQSSGQAKAPIALEGFQEPPSERKTEPLTSSPAAAQQINLFVDAIVEAERKIRAEAGANESGGIHEERPRAITTSGRKNAGSAHTESLAPRPGSHQDSDDRSPRVMGIMAAQARKAESAFPQAQLRAMTPRLDGMQKLEYTINLIEQLVGDVNHNLERGRSASAGSSDFESHVARNRPGSYDSTNGVERNGGNYSPVEFSLSGNGSVERGTPYLTTGVENRSIDRPAHGIVRVQSVSDPLREIEAAEQIVDIVAEALAEQARRHGVDLT